MITTDSFDLPSPGIVPTRDMMVQAATVLGVTAVSQHIVDLVKIRLAKNGITSATQVNQAIQRLLPPEIIAGQRMDLNRPFGNGRDDNNNGVVDEPGEVEATAWNANSTVTQWPRPPTAFSGSVTPNLTNGIDVNGDNSITTNTGGTAVTDAMLARHLYARHLYVLMMLLLDQNTNLTVDGEGHAPGRNSVRGCAMGQ